MSVRVRWLGPAGLALLLGASLLNSSTAVGLAPWSHHPSESLNLKSDSASRSSLPPGEPVAVIRPVRVFAVPAPAAPRGREDAPVQLADGQWAIRVETTVGLRSASMLTNAPSVSDLLQAMEVKLAKSDQVRPSRGVTLLSGEHVVVTRIRVKLTRVFVDAPYQTLIQDSKDLPLGVTRVVKQGADGKVALTYRTTYRNGKEASRRVIAADVVSQPAMEVVVRGTGPSAPEPVPTIAAAIAAAPASAGAGPSVHTQSGQASWYECTGDFAAHLTLPKGTHVTVTNLDNGQSVTVVINDRGPYGVPGRIIDLCTTAFSQIAPLAQGVADVQLSW
jgi:hypothetical protein